MKFEKTTLGILLCLMVIGMGGRVWAVASSVPLGYVWKISSFGIGVDAPPFQAYVEDSQGRITGADPSVSVDQYGIQGNFEGGLAEIPLSDASQENNADPNGVPDNHTRWDMDFDDGGKQTYQIHLKGITSAATTIYLGAVYGKSVGKPSIGTQLFLLSSPNVSKEIDVTFDPTQNTITSKPILSNSDLLTDVKTACQLNLITSRRVCKRLEDEAQAIQEALDKNRLEEAKKLLEGFLRSLGVGRGEGDNGWDDHGAIKEPALTILIQDAKALLAQVEQNEKGQNH